MNYIGSKFSLLPFLERHITEFSRPDSGWTFFDIFSGTGIVGRHFKKLGFRIVANDIQYYSYCLNRAYIGINRQPEFGSIVENLPRPADLQPYEAVDTVLDHLNRLDGVEGFIYRNYCPGGTAGKAFPRQYFTDDNGKLCDAIRLQIEDWHRDALISDDEYFYLLASLIEAIDKVANTASVYGAFLKHVKPSARKPLRLERLEIIPDNRLHRVYNCDGGELASKVQCDILYVDPPYNQRQYCTNYHVLETIAKYDNPELYGVTGLRDYNHQKSDFCHQAKALQSLEKLIQETQAKYVFLSYNSEGLMREDEIMTVMRQYGEVDLKKEDYRRFRADIDRENRRYKTDSVTEYLFCLKKAG
ncbi:DNA adenine methylase [Chloracidobacterium thermophilum]|uniref:DNA adenine methylase n=1 Tax=Chloracidobacterium thermophilum TaxID=458033 RepID=UPI000738ADA0|nr:DNA adenine methylase [Chloracidobacterium thermophilum]